MSAWSPTRPTTRSTGEDQGIQDDVLQPGIYFLNPEEKRVDIISVGFNETTQMVQTRDGSGTGGLQQPAGHDDRQGPGLRPRHRDRVPLQRRLPDPPGLHGDLGDPARPGPRRGPPVRHAQGRRAEGDPARRSARSAGSTAPSEGAVDLLVGDTREEFQTDTSEELETVLAPKNLTLLFGLTRHIYVPNQVREPIQKARIADELTKTREQEQLTAKAQADLSEAKAKVVQEQDRTKAETEKMIAQVTAEGEKKAREIEANTERLRAEIDAKTAIVQAQITKTLGEANAKTIELANQAEAERYRQYVQSLGGPDAYNRYVFAEGLLQGPPAGRLLRRPRHLLDRPEGLRAGDARQDRRGIDRQARDGVNAPRPADRLSLISSSGEWGVGSGEWGVGRWGVGSGEWGVGSGEWGVGSGWGQLGCRVVPKRSEAPREQNGGPRYASAPPDDRFIRPKAVR